MKDSTSPEPEIQDALTKLEYLTCLTAHELKGHIEPFGDDYAASQYLDLASDDEISKFLESGSLYDVEKREWRGLGEAECERDVRAMFTTIINAIISNLGRKTESSRTQRFARTTNYSMFAHVEQHGADQCGGPAMVIMATGPSFEDPPRSDGGLDTPFGYTNIASCFQIVMEGDFSEDAQYYADESSVFARCEATPSVHASCSNPNKADVCSATQPALRTQPSHHRGSVSSIPLRSERCPVHS